MTSTHLAAIFQVAFVGIFATAALDLWATTLNRTLGLAKTNWGHVGRWVAGIASGTFRHDSIAAAPRNSYEQLVGWSAHYVIGVVYSAMYLFILTQWAKSPSLVSAAVFGLVTVLAPWVILQPGLGVGYFASHAPKPNVTRTLNLLSHLVFGVALYGGWCVLALAY